MHYIQSLPVYFILLSIVIYIPLRVVFLRPKKVSPSFQKEIIYILIIIYTESLLYWTVFPDFRAEPRDWLGINLIPFSTISSYVSLFFNGGTYSAIINLMGNIAVFVPIGIFFGILKRDSTVKNAFIIGFFSSLFIEITQLTFSYFNILARSFDIDDLILNTFGVLLGYFLSIGSLQLLRIERF